MKNIIGTGVQQWWIPRAKPAAITLALIGLALAASVVLAGRNNNPGVVIAGGGPPTAVGNLGNPRVAPPQSMPYGKSYSQWNMEWYLYAMPMPSSVNPFCYGTDGTIGQSGNVWFLGGTFVGNGNLVRTITVPAGTALFFPVFNAECSTLEADPWYGEDEASLRACANGWGDQIVAEAWGPLFCKVDGVELKNLAQYRCETPLINITIPATPEGDNNIFAVPVDEPTDVLSVGDGVYIFLNPLPVGTHTLEIPNVQYTIHVSPR